MRSFLTKIKVWLEYAKKYVWIAVIVYVIHLTVEGLAVNILWYKAIQPLYYSMT